MRVVINPWIQARGYRDAVNYLLTRSDVRADRIAAAPSSRASTGIGPTVVSGVPPTNSVVRWAFWRRRALPSMGASSRP